MVQPGDKTIPKSLGNMLYNGYRRWKICCQAVNTLSRAAGPPVDAAMATTPIFRLLS
jgi:hypothetical protein